MRTSRLPRMRAPQGANSARGHQPSRNPDGRFAKGTPIQTKSLTEGLNTAVEQARSYWRASVPAHTLNASQDTLEETERALRGLQQRETVLMASGKQSQSQHRESSRPRSTSTFGSTASFLNSVTRFLRAAQSQRARH